MPELTIEPTVDPDALTDTVIVTADGLEVHIPDMTGEQFAWHMQKMAAGLVLLAPKLEEVTKNRQAIIDSYRGGEAGCRAAAAGGWDPFARTVVEEHDHYARQLELHRDIMNFTSRLFGADWMVVFVDNENAVALAYRMGRMDPELAKAWYNGTALVLQTTQSVLDTIEWYAQTMAEIRARWSFWNTAGLIIKKIFDIPAQLFRVVLDALASFAASVLRAVGTALQPIGEGLSELIWKIIKSFGIPVLVIGGVVIGGPYVWRFAQANFANARKPKLPAAAVEAVAEAISQSGLRRQGVRRRQRRLYR
jgi:hypothetical protein